MADLTGMMQAAAGAAGEENLYIEDVFSTYLYTGNGSTQTITNGIDLAGEGGLVWIKSRSAATNNFLFDTERGVTDELNSNTTDAEASLANSLTAFNSDGFSISSATGIGVNAATYASWTFRKQPKFFDVVTYTGDGVAGRTVAHNLGSTPGCIIVKATSAANDWLVYHTSLGNTQGMSISSTSAAATSTTYWNNTSPTSTQFTVGTSPRSNENGTTFVAYLFAHDAGGFGASGSENVISCGSYTGNGSATGPVVTLGYEPQWILFKNAAAATSGGSVTNWRIYDNMRGWVTNGNEARLFPNLDNTENAADDMDLTPTGFKVTTSIGSVNGSGENFIYIAIRRGPMKTPTSGTEVFAPVAYAGDSSATRLVNAGINIDANISAKRSGPDFFVQSRLTGVAYLRTRATGSETASSGTNGIPTILTSKNNTFGFIAGASTLSNVNETGSNYVDWAFTRAPGFFDVVCYTGTGANRTVAHNLGVVPELMIIKNRSQTDAWAVYAGDNTDYLVLNDTAATADDNTYWNDTSPTSTVFSVGTVHNTNASAENYIAYLFASCPGVSKVGTYTGNGSSVTVTTGFQPRFILVKRTDSTGNWIVGDSARGLVAGDDPYLLLNSNAAEDTDEDWVDVSATGFTVNETAANACVNTGTYIYLAIS